IGDPELVLAGAVVLDARAVEVDRVLALADDDALAADRHEPVLVLLFGFLVLEAHGEDLSLGGGREEQENEESAHAGGVRKGRGGDHVGSTLARVGPGRRGPRPPGRGTSGTGRSPAQPAGGQRDTRGGPGRAGLRRRRILIESSLPSGRMVSPPRAP